MPGMRSVLVTVRSVDYIIAISVHVDYVPTTNHTKLMHNIVYYYIMLNVSSVAMYFIAIYIQFQLGLSTGRGRGNWDIFPWAPCC